MFRKRITGWSREHTTSKFVLFEAVASRCSNHYWRRTVIPQQRKPHNWHVSARVCEAMWSGQARLDAQSRWTSAKRNHHVIDHKRGGRRPGAQSRRYGKRGHQRVGCADRQITRTQRCRYQPLSIAMTSAISSMTHATINQTMTTFARHPTSTSHSTTTVSYGEVLHSTGPNANRLSVHSCERR